MFKFGKYAESKSPYAQYANPVNMVTGHVSTGRGYTISKPKTAKTRVTAGSGDLPFGGGQGSPNDSFNTQGASIGNSGGSGFNVDRYNPVFDQLEEGTILEDWIPRDGAGLDLLFRRIYLRDPTIGPGIDIIRALPWSDFHLEGIEDKEVLKVYQECTDMLNPQLLLPDVTGNFLTLGRDVSSTIFDEKRGIFSGIVPHDADFLRITPMPLYGVDPLCDFVLSPGFKKFLQSTDPRAMDARKALPTTFLDAARANQGFLPLDPVSTIYLARKMGTTDSIGTSLLTRTLYFWAIEKALLNATLASTRRRARSFMHIKAGIDNVWDPVPEEMDALAGLVIQVTEDPVGGVIATRTGVDISEPVSSGEAFYKWSDELELFAKYKMQCIGISDALLSGESTYNNAEQARSVFVETLATLRATIVNKMFTKKLYQTIARIHGFVKRTPAELSHRLRISQSSKLPEWAVMAAGNKLTQRRASEVPVENLQIPTIVWTKQLKPNQDEKTLDILDKLKQNEYPVTLEQWATAAGYNPKTIEADSKRDAELKQKLRDIEDSYTGGTGEETGEEIPGGEESPEMETPEEEPVSQSVYATAKSIKEGPVRKLAQIAIWKNGRCGMLSRIEAAKVTASLIKDNSPELFKDSEALLGRLQDTLGRHKAPVMAYVLNRLGIARLPLSPREASMIAASARAVLDRNTTFKSETAMLDLRRYEIELKSLARLTGKLKPQKKQIVSAFEKIAANNLGPKLYSGSQD